MAFEFVVEDGTGLTDANSLATVQEANDYAVSNIHASALWDGKSDEEKEYLLVYATRIICAMTVWKGTKTYPGAALPIPRIGWYDREGLLIPEDVIPVEVKYAVIETAIRLISSDRAVERPQDGLKELRVDDIWLTFKEGYRLSVIPDLAIQYLKGLGSVNTGGPGFPKIVKV